MPDQSPKNSASRAAGGVAAFATLVVIDALHIPDDGGRASLQEGLRPPPAAGLLDPSSAAPTGTLPPLEVRLGSVGADIATTDPGEPNATRSAPLQTPIQTIAQSEDLRALLRWHEGVRLTAYRCTAGCLTIGVGHNLDTEANRAERDPYTRSPATPHQIEKWLTADIEKAYRGLERNFGDEAWFRNLSLNRTIALIDMSFNLGEKGLLKFERTIEHLRSGRFDDAAAEALNSKWATDVGARAKRIADIIRSDILPPIPPQFYPHPDQNR